MKKIAYTGLILFFCFCVLRDARALSDSGRSLLLLGDSAAALGRGGTGVSMHYFDLFYLNPASIASLDRPGLGLQYGSFDNSYNNPDLVGAIPTSYGVFGTSIRFMSISSPEDIKQGYLISLGGAKLLTSRFALGIAFERFTGENDTDLSYTGAAFGSVYRIPFRGRLKNGFGLYDPSVGFSLHAGAYSDECADFNQITMGYHFYFYRMHGVYIGFFNEVTALNDYDDYPVKFGLQSEIDRFTLRIGGIYPQTYDYGDATLGVGYQLFLGGLDLSANYALVHYRENSFVHYGGLTMILGFPDREPPDIGIQVSERYISPNYDGRKDFVLFGTSVTDRSDIKGWRLQILNSDERVVREFRLSDREMEADLSVMDFFSRLVQKKESLVVPSKILWDGTDAKGVQVSDGSYRYSFVVWDERDNIAAARSGMIFVDTAKPEVTLKVADPLFSPNGDGRKDVISVEMKVVTAPTDVWRAGFFDAEGEKVKSYQWTGAAVPSSILWDGKTDEGFNAPAGLYRCFVESTDRAGNRARGEIRGISLTRQYEVADVTVSEEYFSFHREKIIRFFPRLSNTAGLMRWRLVIEDDWDDVVKEFTGTTALPKVITWDVIDADGEKLSDGRYSYYLTAEFINGNIPTSFKKELVVDSESPRLSLDYAPRSFSPDGDGKNDMLTLYPSIQDMSGVREWHLSIYTPWGTIFKIFHGKGIPAEEIKWDGRNHENKLVESAVDYYLELMAIDRAGNISKTKRLPLPIDILVMEAAGALRIRVSNIEFAFNSDTLQGRAFQVLDRVVEILKRYRNYHVKIEGHTDDIGEDQFNLDLSERRAKAVMDYLVDSGIDPERLTFQGMGETAPYLPNTSEENRVRNRRVEFILMRSNERESP